MRKDIKIRRIMFMTIFALALLLFLPAVNVKADEEFVEDETTVEVVEEELVEFETEDIILEEDQEVLLSKDDAVIEDDMQEGPIGEEASLMLIPLDTPELKSIFNVKEGIDVRFAHVEGATSYVFIRTANGVEARIAEVKAEDIPEKYGYKNWTDRSVKSEYGKGFAYRVIAKVDLSESLASDQLAIFRLNEPTITKLEASTNSIKISWNKEKVHRYVLQYSADGENWTTIETTSTSRNVTGLKMNSTYYFRVRGVMVQKDGTIHYSQYSTRKSAKTSMEAGLKKIVFKDSNGKILSIQYEDSNGNIKYSYHYLSDGSLYSYVTYEYKNNRIRKTTTYYADGRLMQIIEYDEYGRMVKETYFSANQVSSITIYTYKGSSSLLLRSETYNGDNVLISRTVYSYYSSGTMSKTVSYYASSNTKYESIYNTKGQLTKYIAYKNDVITQYSTYTYNSKGVISSQDTYNGNDQLTRHDDYNSKGMISKTTEYNDSGLKVRETIYNNDGYRSRVNNYVDGQLDHYYKYYYESYNLVKTEKYDKNGVLIEAL